MSCGFAEHSHLHDSNCFYNAPEIETMRLYLSGSVIHTGTMVHIYSSFVDILILIL